MSKNTVTAILGAIAFSLITGIYLIARDPRPTPQATEVKPSPTPTKSLLPDEIEAQCRALFPSELELPTDSLVTIPAKDGRKESKPNQLAWEGAIKINEGVANLRPFRCNATGETVQIIRRPDTYSDSAKTYR